MQSGFFFVNPPQHSVSNSKNQANTATENKAEDTSTSKKTRISTHKKVGKSLKLLHISKKIHTFATAFHSPPSCDGKLRAT